MMTHVEKLLIVDNEAEFRISVSKFLTGEGYQITSVDNGEEALCSLKDEKIDLVVTELKMPGLNGLEFLREVKKISPTTKLVVLTAYGEWLSYLEALEAGAVEYLNKPIKNEELLETVHKILENSECS